MKQTALFEKPPAKPIPPRKLYKFSHSVHQGGYLYMHKTADNEPIKDKNGLRLALEAVEKQLGLMDVTIKII